MSYGTILAQILSFPVDARIRIAQDIWDSVAESQSELPLSEEHRSELRRRLEAHQRDPSAVSPWEEVKTRLREQLQRG